MKKYFLISIFMMLLALSNATAQDFKIGPKAGIAASWLPGTNIDPFDKVRPHNNFYAGLSAEYYLTDLMMMQVEALYVGKGYSDRNHGADGGLYSELWNTKYSLDLGYVVVPVYVGFHFLDKAMSIMIGPEFGYNVFARSNKSFNPEIYRDREAIIENQRDNVRRFNIGLGLQVSYQFIAGLGFDAKVSYGLNRTFRDGRNGAGNIMKGGIDQGRNLCLQFGLFYKFEM